MTYCILLPVGLEVPLPSNVKLPTSLTAPFSLFFFFFYPLTSSFLTSRAGCLDFSILTFSKWPHSMAVVLNTIPTLRVPYLASPAPYLFQFPSFVNLTALFVSPVGCWRDILNLGWLNHGWCLPPTPIHTSRFLIVAHPFFSFPYPHIQFISKYFWCLPSKWMLN